MCGLGGYSPRVRDLSAPPVSLADGEKPLGFPGWVISGLGLIIGHSRFILDQKVDIPVHDSYSRSVPTLGTGPPKPHLSCRNYTSP